MLTWSYENNNMGRPKRVESPIKQAEFVKELLKTKGNATQAARNIGLGSDKTPHAKEASRLMQQAGTKALIAKATDALMAEGIYNLKIAMKEAEEAIEFARQTKNANAYVKAVELRSKLNGLLIERVEQRTSGFQVLISRPALPTDPAFVRVEHEVPNQIEAKPAPVADPQPAAIEAHTAETATEAPVDDIFS